MKKSHPYRRTIAAGFILTLLICGFISLSGIALRNTAAAMFGTDRSIVEITAAQAAPELEISLLDKRYRVNLSGANQAAGEGQRNYALVPRSFRLVQTLFEGLREGLNSLF